MNKLICFQDLAARSIDSFYSYHKRIIIPKANNKILKSESEIKKYFPDLTPKQRGLSESAHVQAWVGYFSLFDKYSNQNYQIELQLYSDASLLILVSSKSPNQEEFQRFILSTFYLLFSNISGQL